MGVRPARLRDFRLRYGLRVAAFGDHRHSQPKRTVRRDNPVPAAPVTLGELNVVQKNKVIRLADQVKITPPGKVARLEDNNTSQNTSPNGLG